MSRMVDQCKCALLVAMASVCTVPALGAITLWSTGYTPNVDYTINDVEGVVRILKSRADTPWKFEAYNGATPADINRIITGENANPADIADIHLYIVGDPSLQHTVGAANVAEINLITNKPSGVVTTIEELNISADLGELNVVRATNMGTLTVGGDVINDTQQVTVAGQVPKCAAG